MHESAGVVAAGAGPGGPKSVGGAVGWDGAAADSGVAESAAALGSAHFQGIDGFVKRDLGEAEKWFEMALFLGMAEAAGAAADFSACNFSIASSKSAQHAGLHSSPKLFCSQNSS